MKRGSLYVHVPFCEKKCLYCDFYSIEGTNAMQEFLDALFHEINLSASLGEGREFETIFLGGGTPSLLTPEQLSDVLGTLRSVFRLADDPEVTIEVNPGTVNKERLSAYRQAGVNRLSIGIQSFHEDELRFLSRIHSAEEAVRAVKDGREAGFGNISVDLIYSLPGQTNRKWEETLARAVDLGPEHISAYGLIVEERTPLFRLVSEGKVIPNGAEAEAALYEWTMEFLAHRGYEHYEVSNYAKPGFRSRHNYNYWSHREYLGFGPSAHSYALDNNGSAKRWWNAASINRYCAMLRAGELPRESQEVLTSGQRLTERIFLGLRSDGLDLNMLQQEFGFTLPTERHEVLAGLVDGGLAVQEGSVVRLTPKGFVLCDEICRRLMP